MDKAVLLRESLLDHLQSGRWPAGHRLPTERALCEQFGLSRSTVRRTLAQLKDRGLITQTVGSGTYVNDQTKTGLTAHGLAGEGKTASPAELMAARLILEPAIVELVVQNATDADFASMDLCCDEGEAAHSFEVFEHWDGALHEAIAAATHNAFINSVFKLMNAARAQSSWGMLKRRSLTAERRLAYQQEHRDLVAALKDRNAAEATARARQHLLHVRENLLGY